MDEVYLEEIRLRRKLLFRLMKNFDFDAPRISARQQIAELVSDQETDWSVSAFYSDTGPTDEKAA